MALSSVTTGGFTVSAAALAPIVSWGLAGFSDPAPEGTALLIAAGIITGGHALYNLVQAKLAAKAVAPAPTSEKPNA